MDAVWAEPFFVECGQIKLQSHDKMGEYESAADWILCNIVWFTLFKIKEKSPAKWKQTIM